MASIRVWRSRCLTDREETEDFSDMSEEDISEMASLSFSGEVTIRARVLTMSCFVFCSTYSLFVYVNHVSLGGRVRVSR